MARNVIHWKTREADLALLIKKGKKVIEKAVYPYTVETLAAELWEDISKLENHNPSVNIWGDAIIAYYIVACTGLELPNGKIVPPFVLPYKKSVSREDIDYLTFAMVPEDWKQYAKVMGQYYWEKFIPVTYQNLKSKKAVFISLNITLRRSINPEANEIWKDSLSLIPFDPAEAEKYYQNMKDYFGRAYYDFSEEKKNMLRSFINNTIFPCESLLVGIPKN